MKSREKKRSTLRDKVRILTRIRHDGAGSVPVMDQEMARGRVTLVVRIFPGIFFILGARLSGALRGGRGIAERSDMGSNL